MSFLSLRERLELRRVVSNTIANGQLPQGAAVVLHHADAFAALEQHVADNYHADLNAGLFGGVSGGSHPILQYIVSHIPQILQLVLTLLPLFGVPVPPITIPGLPPLPSPTTTTAHAMGPVGDPTQPHAAGMPTDFAIPAAVIALMPYVEQVAAQVVAALLPTIEAKVEQWVKDHVVNKAA